MKTFVDTNVLVYAHDTDVPDKRAVASDLVRSLWDARSGALSTQVLQEFYVNITGKIATRVPRREARDLVRAYAAWHLVGIEAPDIVAASELQDRAQLSFWDALIVTAALKANADVLLTEDLNPGRNPGAPDTQPVQFSTHNGTIESRQFSSVSPSPNASFILSGCCGHADSW